MMIFQGMRCFDDPQNQRERQQKNPFPSSEVVNSYVSSNTPQSSTLWYSKEKLVRAKGPFWTLICRVLLNAEV